MTRPVALTMVIPTLNAAGGLAATPAALSGAAAAGLETEVVVAAGFIGHRRRRRVALAPSALTSAARYRREGYLKRALRNVACQSLWRLGAPDVLVRPLYG